MFSDPWSPASRRSTLYARHGAVATSQPLAAQVGLDVLKQGGNAADAAIAVAAMLNVVEPMSTGIGGDAFCLYYQARSRRIFVLNGSGCSPRAANIQRFAADGLSDSIPLTHPHSVTVPGTVAAWADTITRFGTRSLAHVLAPAITYARAGFAVSPIIAGSWALCAPKLREAGSYLPGGEPPEVGQVVRLPELADSLDAIGQSDGRDFYEGRLANKIVAHHQRLGGLLSAEDLAAHESTWVEPISINFGGVRVFQCPPNGQGLAVLIALGILQGFDDLAECGEVLRCHRMIEAIRLAFADARRWVTDLEFGNTKAVVESLLEPGYLAQRRSQIVDGVRSECVESGIALPGGPDTVYLTVVDGEGNACSFINSLFHGFGSGIVVPGTGICLQNRGALFSMNPTHPNRLEPGKRPYHTIIPAMSTHKDGSLHASFGVMGGFMQPQGQVQLLVNRLILGLDPQQAMDAPRFLLRDGDPEANIAYESGFCGGGITALEFSGHQMERVDGWGRVLFGGGQYIERDPGTGVLACASDPRKDGQAVGW